MRRSGGKSRTTTAKGWHKQQADLQPGKESDQENTSRQLTYGSNIMILK